MENGRYFFGQHQNEKLIFFVYKHWFVLVTRMLKNMIIFLFATLLFILWVHVEKTEDENFFIFLSQHPNTFLVFYVWILVHIHAFFLQMFNYFLRILILTDTRFIEVRESLFFEKNRESVDLEKIQDIQGHKNGVFETMFDFGNINITLANIQDSKMIRHIPAPLHLIEYINTLKRRLMFKHEQLETSGLPEAHQHTHHDDVI